MRFEAVLISKSITRKAENLYQLKFNKTRLESGQEIIIAYSRLTFYNLIRY